MGAQVNTSAGDLIPAARGKRQAHISKFQTAWLEWLSTRSEWETPLGDMKVRRKTGARNSLRNRSGEKKKTDTKGDLAAVRSKGRKLGSSTTSGWHVGNVRFCSFMQQQWRDVPKDLDLVLCVNLCTKPLYICSVRVYYNSKWLNTMNEKD